MKQNILKGASILSAILMLSVVMTPVLAAEVQPFNRWGYANDGAGLLDTELITAWIDGVEYGADITGTGGDIGLFSIDVFGDSTDSPTEKRGGYNGDTVYYVHGDLTTAGVFFAETDSWLVGGFNTVAADINEVGATPALLKINNVASQAGFAVDDYIVIYNPSAAPVDLFGFSIAIGGGAPAPIAAVCADSVNPVAAGGWAAIDLTGLLSTTGNSITLQETATGYIVDRVEYGAIATEPENTWMTNAVNPAADMEIYRVPAMGADTNDNAVDFGTQAAVDHGGITPVTATATGPIGIGIAAIDITYTTTGSPATAEIFVSENGGAFASVGIDNPADGTFAYVCPGVTGDQYDFIANVPGGDDDGVGIPGGPAEAGSWELDLLQDLHQRYNTWLGS